MTQKFLDTKRQNAAPSFFHYYTSAFQVLSYCSFFSLASWQQLHAPATSSIPLTTPELTTTIITPFIIQFHLLPGILLEPEDGADILSRNVENNYQIAEERIPNGNMLNTSVK
jgi:hypothetical protein